MAKVRRSFVCNQCGSVSPKWVGKCGECGAWDSLEEFTPSAAGGSEKKDPQRGLAEAWAAEGEIAAGNPEARRLDEIEPLDVPRLATGIGELDRVLGGGLVPGSTVLIGGEPGIGKSTLLLQAAARIARMGQRVLYVTSEESSQQIQMRAMRLDVNGRDARSTGDARSTSPADLFVLADTNLARIFAQAGKVRPAVMVIDSVQMIYNASLDASPGSMTQLRRCCMELVYLAKATQMAIVLVGHVTKDGQVAGPRLLEHLVDAVLYFEGDRYHAHRIVRGVKNRFGTTLEIGLFEMGEFGLAEVVDPSGVLSSEAGSGVGKPGCVIVPAMQGSRCFMVEVQALTASGILGAARRRVSGLDANRLSMILAVLEQHAGLRLADQDVFASVVGGMKVAEPAADLGLALAIAGSHLRKAGAAGTVALGEVGLSGEVRRVSQMEQRLREAARLGFKRALVPAGAAADKGPAKSKGANSIEIVPVRSVSSALERWR
ncbi:MAG: DNA repair protein RadA [Phycisphaerales bacterium]|nr:DNA repair protein RadA [Phycisphaerales bacterium]